MAKTQRDRRAAVEHETVGQGAEFVPQRALRRRQDVEARREVGRHRASLADHAARAK